MPYPHEHAARVANPDEFRRIRDITEAMRRRGWEIPAGIRCLGGPKKDGGWGVQAWRADASRWTAAEFRAWLEREGHEYVAFEEATGESKTADDVEPDSEWDGGEDWALYRPGQKAILPSDLRLEVGAGIAVYAAHGKEIVAVEFARPQAEAERWVKHTPELWHAPGARKELRARVERPIVGEVGEWGIIEGYAAVWNSVDWDGERFVRGAFARSIRERVTAGKVKLMARHWRDGGDVADVIGTCVEAREDEYGLWGRYVLADSGLAQETREKVKAGHVRYLSVGFVPVRWRDTQVDGRQVREYIECVWLESTVTVRPANEDAIIVMAKSLLADGAGGDAATALRLASKLREAMQELAGSPNRVVEAKTMAGELKGLIRRIQ